MKAIAKRRRFYVSFTTLAFLLQQTERFFYDTGLLSDSVKMNSGARGHLVLTSASTA